MNRLLMLTSLAVLTVGLSGCGRNWGQWWNRGAMCSPEQPHATYMPMQEDVIYDDAMIVQPGPPVTIPPLPGPVN